MQEVTDADSANGIYIVRHGDGDTYAICQKIEAVPGSHTLPGSTSTVAQMVDEQQLQAAFMQGKPGGIRSLSFEPQSGENVTITVEN